MSVHRHLLSQGRGLASLVSFLARGPSAELGAVPGPVESEVVDPPGSALVSDFVRFCGGDPSLYRDTLPPHLFPQWSLPVMLEAAKQLPYPPVKVINAGFRLELLALLPSRERLRVNGQLLSVEESERTARITIRVETAPLDGSVALRADLRVVVRLPRKRDASDARRPPKERPRVPTSARELGSVALGPRAGLHFAELTGDFNPIHWLPAYARAVGFKSAILHGFGTSAVAMETLVRAVLAGRIERLSMFDANFVRPLVLPRRVGIYLHPEGPGDAERAVSVGDGLGGPAYLTASFRLRG